MLVLWSALLALAILYILLRHLKRRNYHLPPGPWGLPYLGNVLQLDREAPHSTMSDWAEKYGAVFSVNLFGIYTVVLNDYDTIYEGLATQATAFAGRPESYRHSVILGWRPDIALTSFSKRWLFRKKVSTTTIKTYERHDTYFENAASYQIHDLLEALTKIADVGPADLHPFLNRCVTGILALMTYGDKIPVKEIDSLHSAVQMITEMMHPSTMYTTLDVFPIMRYIPNPWNYNLHRNSKVLQNIISKHIDKRRSDFNYDEPRCVCDGLLSQQKNAEENKLENKLTDDELFTIISNTFGAGIAIATTIDSLLAVLVNKPEIQERAFTEIRDHIGDRRPLLEDKRKLHYVEAVLLEILRYSSITALNVPHTTLQDTKINGYDIPKDTQVLYNLWKLHHEPKYWDEPWEFKPERFLDENGKLLPATHIKRKRLLAFGIGRRVCVGETLVKNCLFLMSTSIMQHFKFLPAGPNELPKHDPRQYKNSISLHPHPYRVQVKLREY